MWSHNFKEWTGLRNKIVIVKRFYTKRIHIPSFNRLMKKFNRSQALAISTSLEVPN